MYFTVASNPLFLKYSLIFSFMSSLKRKMKNRMRRKTMKNKKGPEEKIKKKLQKLKKTENRTMLTVDQSKKNSSEIREIVDEGRAREM